MLKIRRPLGRLIFNMGIAIPGKTVFLIETAPWWLPLDLTGPRFNIKMWSYQYRKSHCGDKTVVRSSYLHNGISFTGKMTSLYWIGALMIKSTLFQVIMWCCQANNPLPEPMFTQISLQDVTRPQCVNQANHYVRLLVYTIEPVFSQFTVLEWDLPSSL